MGPELGECEGSYARAARAILLARLMTARTPPFNLYALTRAFCLGLSARR
jgi:hypothetical protein